MTIHKILLKSLLLLCLLVLAGVMAFTPGCGDSDDTLKVALTGKFPPFSFYDDQGRVTGFDVDVSRQIASRLGKKVEFVTVEWDGILAGLLSGKYDCIISSMAITKERAEKVNFSNPYYISGAQLFVHENKKDEIDSIEDIGEGRIGVVLGETYEQYMRTRHPEINIATYKGTPDIFQEMDTGRLDGFVTDRLVGMYQIKSAGREYAPAGELLYKETLAIPTVKSDKKLLADINGALENMSRSGELRRIHMKWFGLPPAMEGTPEMTGAVEQRPDTGGMSGGTIAKMLAKGFGITLVVAIISIVAGFLISLPTGIVLNRAGGVTRFVVRTVVDFIRGTPVIIQLFFVYYGIAPVLDLNPLLCAIITLSINCASYMAEIIRSGLMAVDPGQQRASKALGLTRFQTFRYVVWPQAFRIAIPTLMNSAVALLKDTALISIISVREVLMEAQSIIAVTFEPMKIFFFVLLMFFIFTYPLMKLAGKLEAKIKEKGFSNA